MTHPTQAFPGTVDGRGSARILASITDYATARDHASRIYDKLIEIDDKRVDDETDKLLTPIYETLAKEYDAAINHMMRQKDFPRF